MHVNSKFIRLRHIRNKPENTMTIETPTQEHISPALTKLCTENNLWKSAEHTDILAENINTCPKKDRDSNHLPQQWLSLQVQAELSSSSDGQMISFTAGTLPTCPYNSFEKQLGDQGDLALPCSFPLRRIVQVQELTESRKNNIPLQYTVTLGLAIAHLIYQVPEDTVIEIVNNYSNGIKELQGPGERVLPSSYISSKTN